MPVSNKRPRRAAREVASTNADVPDSSPSRPAKRRKKVPEPVAKPEPEPKLPADREGLQMDDDELVAAIARTLQVPAHEVAARNVHANSRYEEENKEGVQAYAKLAGRDWTFYVKDLKNVIGRPPEGVQSSSDNADGDAVHIDLGPFKMVSRLHAEIYFDSESERWNIVVHGRNGIRINNHPVRKGEIRALVSGEIIDVSGVEMMFVLPQEGRMLQVSKQYLVRAGLIDPQATDDEDHAGATTSSAPSSSIQSSRGQNGTGPLPIAPAPPNYQRPGTPPASRTKAQYSAGKSPYAHGTMMMNAEDVDLSLDDNQHIKPSFSYAQMISQAILSAEDEKLNLAGIYKHITDKFAYYRHQLGGGWQNSIRHNLSLNKNFIKVARGTEEPGKGMKWCIVPENKDEMARSCVKGGRGGHRGSSAPSSPANNLTHRAKDSAKKRSPKSKSKSKSPPTSSFPVNAPQFTPDRSGQSSMRDLPGDGSPLPRHRKQNNSLFGISDNVPGSPPVLSSSYLQDDGGSFVTPAPARVHPRLAPPSTAQRPSQYIQTSSPAPFWRYAGIGTPMKDGLDSSPIKGGNAAAPPSSSPPPPARSPSRKASPAKPTVPDVEEIEEEDGGFDLTKGFQSIGSYHAPISNGIHAPPLAPPIQRA